MLINYETTPASKRLTTIDSLRSGFEEFFKEKGRYPSSDEINKYKYLPSVRLLERRFGGTVKVRKLIGLEDVDFRKGKIASEKCIRVNRRGRDAENEIHRYLSEKFGEVNIHRERMVSDNLRQRMDFYVFNKKFFVEVFYPSDLRNFTGCLNAKLKKLEKVPNEITVPIYFVQLNQSIPEEEIEKTVRNKKNKLGKNIKVIGVSKFQEFINSIK